MLMPLTGRHITPRIQRKVFFFANLPTDDPRSIGGATVLAKRIFEFLKKDNRLQVDHFQIRKRWRPKFQLIDYFKWLFLFPLKIKGYDVVSFHATRDFHPVIAPFLVLWAKMLGKKVVYHFFGGGFHREYEHYPFFWRFLIRQTVLRSDYLLFETKELVEYFQHTTKGRVIWFPNSRFPVSNVEVDKPYTRKAVFISRITPGKGVEEVIRTAELLPADYRVDAYGPLDSKIYRTSPFDNTRVHYRGILPPDRITSVLSQYDWLLMPTYIPREGYPGIIIEALSMAVPVITTRCCVMHEIIRDGYNGYLVPVKDPQAIVDSITGTSAEQYRQLRQNAIESFHRHFNSEKVFGKLVKAYLE